jgi:hypothetical protein
MVVDEDNIPWWTPSNRYVTIYFRYYGKHPMVDSIK